MEAYRRRRRNRNPLSDCTNTSFSSSVTPKPCKPYPSSSPLNKPSTKIINLDSATNPSSPSPPILSTSSPKSPSLNGTVDVEASEPISIVYSRKRSRNKRSKDKGKEVVVPVSSTPILKISNNRFEGEDLSKAKALTFPCIKKRRIRSSEDAFREQDEIEKQKAYFKMIDEFELLEEKAGSGDESD